MAVSKRGNKRIEKRSFFSRASNNRLAKSNKKESSVKLFFANSAWSSIVAWGGTFSICVLLLVILSVGLIFSYKYIMISKYFAIREVTILGNIRLDSREILETCRIGNGGSLLAVNLDELQSLLVKNPWVQEASVSRVLPDVLSISIKEKTPAFWLESEGLLYYSDVTGNKIALVEKEFFTSFPTLVVEEGTEGLKEQLPEIVRSLSKAALPIDMTAVSWLRLSVASGVELYLESTDLKIAISQDNWAENLNNLALALVDLANKGELKSVNNVRAQSGKVWARKG